MLTWGVLILLAVYVTALPLNITDNEIVAPRLTPGSDITDYTTVPFIASLINPSDSPPVFYGLGVVVAPHWVLCRAREGLEVENLKDSVFIYTSVLDTRNAPSGDKHKIRSIIYHPDFIVNDVKDDIALIRTCPSININKFATLPDLGQAYTPLNVVKMIAYRDGPFAYGSLAIFGPNWCSANSPCVQFDANKHYLTYVGQAQWTPNVANVAAYGSFIISNDQVFQGFTVAASYYNSDGDLFLYTTQRAELFKAWVLSIINN